MMSVHAEPNLSYNLGYGAMRACLRALLRRDYDRASHYWSVAWGHAKFVREYIDQTAQQIMMEWQAAVSEEMGEK